MTIAKRLLLLLSIPLATLVGLGVFTKMELDRIDERGRFVAETQISSLAVAATIIQTFSDLRADARSYLLVDDAKSRSELQTAVERRKTEVARDRKSTRLNSSHVSISYAVFCLKKKKIR